MPKLICTVPGAKLVTMKQLCPDETPGNQESWETRIDYLDFEGALYLFQSLHDYPGKYAVLMIREEEDKCAWFHTSHGEYAIIDNQIHLKTKNSYYIFDILDNQMTDEKQFRLEYFLRLYEQVKHDETV